MTIQVLASMVGDRIVPGKFPAWVAPGVGSDLWVGTDPEQPFATLGKAISDGHRMIHVRAGTHTVSSIDTPVTLVFYPGTHTFANTPITVTAPITLRGYTPLIDHRYDGTGECSFTSSGLPSSLFYATSGYVTVKDLRFNPLSVSKALIETRNVSGRVDRCKNVHGTGQEYANPPIVWAEATDTPIEWSMRSCWSPRSTLLYVDSGTQVGTVHLRENVSFGGCAPADYGTYTSQPFVWVRGLNVGSTVHDSSNETRSGGTSNARGVMVFDGETRNLTFMGNGQERISTYGIDYYFDNVSSSFFVHSNGQYFHSGHIVVNGTLISSTVWPDSKENVIINMPVTNPYS